MANFNKPVIFKLGNESYGVDINLVNSIEKQVNFVPVPNSLPYVKGIMNLRGEIIPLISLKKRFNMEETGEKSENAIIVKLPQITLALEVDAVEEIHDIPEAAISQMPQIVQSEELRYFEKVANINGKLVVLINVEHLLDERALSSIVKLTDDLK